MSSACFSARSIAAPHEPVIIPSPGYLKGGQKLNVYVNLVGAIDPCAGQLNIAGQSENDPDNGIC
jgi:hypothetical protein